MSGATDDATGLGTDDVSGSDDPTASSDEDPATAVSTMRAARSTVADRRDPDGEFHVACRRTGLRPDPVSDATFETYLDAEQACAAARRYRDALARLDPSLTRYDLTVYREDSEPIEVACIRETTDERRANGLPVARQTVTVAGSGYDEWLRVENGPVVDCAAGGSLLDDEIIARQLDEKL